MGTESCKEQAKSSASTHHPKAILEVCVYITRDVKFTEIWKPRVGE